MNLIDIKEKKWFAFVRLRLIIEHLLDSTNQSWLYIGKELTAMTLQSPSSTTLCYVPNRSLLTIHCQRNDQQEQVCDTQRSNEKIFVFFFLLRLVIIDDDSISIESNKSIFIISNHCLSSFNTFCCIRINRKAYQSCCLHPTR